MIMIASPSRSNFPSKPNLAGNFVSILNVAGPVNPMQRIGIIPTAPPIRQFGRDFNHEDRGNSGKGAGSSLFHWKEPLACEKAMREAQQAEAGSWRQGMC
ncbi:hypothetical protein [Mesorhizobium sp. B2-3-4]|uniref:hypothetical protein n=1 Tax=Mesorhizobium sp. B2-3-4 TaxID=2589959 RepID=UPI00112AEB2F|nr:hypothetical protein [Mesorhizobium sp. B2-3-4]TPM31887.1 hypothetical protein FJ967_24265 [Mesorhizobium sp. B2-3-4]